MTPGRMSAAGWASWWPRSVASGAWCAAGPAPAWGARRWNDANVLAFGLRLTSPTVAGEMIEAFLKTEPDAAEAANIAKLT